MTKLIEQCYRRRSKRLAIQEASQEKLDLAGLERCEHLEELLLTEQDLDAVPPEVENLKQLKLLNLGCNPIREIPEWLLGLKHLDTIDFGWSEVTELPEWLPGLRKLSHLWAEKAKIRRVAGDWSQHRKLEDVRLSENPLGRFPEALMTCRTISSLSLDECEIAHLPAEGWSGMQGLESLYLGGNGIEKLPAALRELQRLKDIDLRDNAFTEIPEVLAELPKLMGIDLVNNRLSSIPEWIWQRPPEFFLDLAGNPCADPQMPSIIVPRGRGAKR